MLPDSRRSGRRAAGRAGSRTSTSAVDRRGSPRYAPKRSAALRLGQSRKPVACELLDISLTGARFKPAWGALAQTLSRSPIEVELEGMRPVRAWPVWVRKGQIGVRFMANSFGRHGTRFVGGSRIDQRYELRERFLEELQIFARESGATGSATTPA